MHTETKLPNESILHYFQLSQTWKRRGFECEDSLDDTLWKFTMFLKQSHKRLFCIFIAKHSTFKFSIISFIVIFKIIYINKFF